MKVCGQSNDTVQHIYGLLKFRKSWKLPLFHIMPGQIS